MSDKQEFTFQTEIKQLLHLLSIEQINIGETTQLARIYREKETSRFNLNVFDRPINLL